MSVILSPKSRQKKSAGSAENPQDHQPVELVSAKVEITLPYLTTEKSCLFVGYFWGVLVFVAYGYVFVGPQGRSIFRGELLVLGSVFKL